MKKLITLLCLASFVALGFSQNLETIFKDNISIRAIEVDGGKVWYAGSGSKFGYVDINNPEDHKQIMLSDKKLDFRTLAQTSAGFYTINVGSPAYWLLIQKKDLKVKTLDTDTAKTVFYDAMVFDKMRNRGITISDPRADLQPHFLILSNKEFKVENKNLPVYYEGEAHFAASNTNISMFKDNVWIVTGGKRSRIFKFNWKNPYYWEAFETPIIQGESSTGIYTVDFANKKFGIIAGGDYTKQKDNINNIATTFDGGKTWQIQASGRNAGYTTCVKIRPKSKGKDIIAVGDQHISYSQDYGKTWKVLSEEKGFYVCEWLGKTTLILAGNGKIAKLKL